MATASPADAPVPLNADDARVELVVGIARALHEAGAPAHRLEATIDALGRALGLDVSCLSQPTSLILGIGDRTRVLRVTPAGVHLDRLVAIDGLAARIARGQVDAQGALAALRAIDGAGPPFPRVVSIVAGGVSSGAAAVFFDASPEGVGVAAGLGCVVGLLEGVAQRVAGYRRVHDLVACFVVAAVATVVGRILPVSATLVTLAGIVALLPGLVLTTALTELATGHLASGTARLVGAGVTLLQLGIGTSLGWRVAALLPPALRPTSPPVPDTLEYAAIPIAAAAFVVVFRARPRDYPWIAGVALAGFLGARSGQAWLGPELGALLAGLIVGLLSNLQAVLRQVPTAVTQVPGLLLLVPGSIGFGGFRAMLDDDVTAGVDAMFRMLVVAASLVAGMLGAGILLPPRRTL
jgi:uncharacterized membrane protein YjjP (DUF1212 family)